jgi:hypothetical protein
LRLERSSADWSARNASWAAGIIVDMLKAHEVRGVEPRPRSLFVRRQPHLGFDLAPSVGNNEQLVISSDTILALVKANALTYQ